MERILVVEDEPSIRKALLMGLASDNFEVHVARNGRSGIVLGQKIKFDILIADLCLPDMEGLEVIENLKKSSPEIISIIITGNASMESSLEAIRLEVNDYLEKPISMKSVKYSIQSGLKKRERKRKSIHNKVEQMMGKYKEKYLDILDSKAKTSNSRSDQDSETISMLIHQINNPLMAIAGGAQLGMLNPAGANAIRQYFAGIIEASEKISEINKEIINFYKPRKENFENIDVEMLLEECLQMFKGTMDLKCITLKKNFQNDLVAVSGNRFGCEQVFNNIILNAIESMNEAPGKILKIRTKINKDASIAYVYIKDTGCGIPEESMDKIFQPYFTNKENGTGLGLPVVKSIVEKNGGNISIDSEVGKGTTFKISFPITNC